MSLFTPFPPLNFNMYVYNTLPTVRRPSLALNMGPIVEPQLESLRTTNSLNFLQVSQSNHTHGARKSVVYLNRDLMLLGQFLQYQTGDGSSGIALVGVDLDDGALVHLRTMVFFVLIGIVGVDGVCHVRTHQDTLVNSLFKCCQRDILGGVNDMCVGQTLESDRQEVGVSTVGCHGSDFFVVKQGGNTDVAVVFNVLGLCQCNDGTVGHLEVVQTRREDELVAGTANHRLLSVVNGQFEITDLMSYIIKRTKVSDDGVVDDGNAQHTLDIHFISQDLDQQGMMVCFGFNAFSSLNAR